MFLVPLHFVRIFRGAFPSLRTRVRRVSHHKSCFRQDREPPFTIRIPKKSQKTHTLFRNRHAGVEFLRERKRNQNNAIRNSNRIHSKMLACDWLPAHTWKLRGSLVFWWRSLFRINWLILTWHFRYHTYHTAYP